MNFVMRRVHHQLLLVSFGEDASAILTLVDLSDVTFIFFFAAAFASK
jgi:hypothetical protein